MIKKEVGRRRTVPSSQSGGGHSNVLGLLEGAGHVVGEVVTGLDGLTELYHHHVGESVSVLVIGEVLAGLENNDKNAG